MRVELLGKRWNLRFVPNLSNCGDCDVASAKFKEIRIQQGMPQKLELDTSLHECLHLIHPSSDEEHVNQSATDIAEILWKLGWRKLTKEQIKDLDL